MSQKKLSGALVCGWQERLLFLSTCLSDLF